MPIRLKYFTTELSVADKDEVLQSIDAATRTQPVTIATVNPEFLLEARENEAFRNALGTMSFCTIDGSGFLMGLKLARLLRRVPQSSYSLYHGSDLVADLLQKYQSGGKKLYLLGGPPGLAERAATAIRIKYPEITIVGAEDGGKITTGHVTADPELLRRIEESAADILLVGFGAPKQELWMQAAGSAAPVMIGIGGTLGFYTDKKRAPKAWRAIHMEWLFRAFTEPGHWRRSLRASVLFPLRSLLWIITGR